MNIWPWLRFLWVALATAGLWLFLLGCGSDIGSPKTEAKAPPSAAATSTPSVTPTPKPQLSIENPVEDIQKFVEAVADGPHEVVKSADGKVELLVPAGALPAGKSIGDIRITPLAASAPKPTLDDEKPAVSYRLEPDGLRFNSPALLKFRLPPAEKSHVPIVFLRSGQNLAQLGPLMVNMDGASGANVMVALAHFSEFHAFREGFFEVSISNVSDRLVGEAVPVSAKTRQWTNRRVLGDGPDKTVLLSKSAWFFGILWREANVVALEPSRFPESPPATNLGPEGFTAMQSFKCVDRGRFQVNYSAWIFSRYTYEDQAQDESRTQAGSDQLVVQTNEAVCKVPPTPTWTPKPAPAMPDPTATPTVEPVVAIEPPVAPPPPPPTTSGDPAKGRDLFGSRGCASCHGADAKGMPNRVARSILGTAPDAIANAIQNGKSGGGKTMPPQTAVTAEERLHITAFLQSR